MTSEESFNQALEDIEHELDERIGWFEDQGMDIEAHRLEGRTKFDLEMLNEIGSCKGVENYSRHFDRRNKGERSYCLLDFFSNNAEKFHGDADRYLVIMDESHVTLPQVGGMYGGDFSRKKNLVDHGFRLPSAYDNRPLRIDEFQELVPQMLYVSATPGERELRHLAEVTDQRVPEELLHVGGGGGSKVAEFKKRSGSSTMEGTLSKIKGVVRMEIRPTGLLDPEIVIKPTKGQVQHLMSEINARIEKNERVLVTVMTIKFAEEVAEYLDRNGIKAHYLHSEIDTLERTEIIKALRLGHIDVIVGINLLREGLDIPEVSLVAIFDADKQGFLRNERSLLQTIGRASRNQNGVVILYADSISPSMEAAMSQTIARRGRQDLHNRENGIVPRTIQKALPTMGQEVGSLLAGTAGKGAKGGKRFVGKFQSKKGVSGLAQKFSLGAGMWNTSSSVLENVSQPEFEIDTNEITDIEERVESEKVVSKLEREMRAAAERLDFEKAAQIRDRIIQLRNPSN